MDNLYAELRDIEGFSKISFWPLAPIWWILMTLVLIVIIAMVIIIRRRINYKNSWRYDTMNILSKLEYNLNNQNSYQTAIELNELIRRIAIHKFSRKVCANLSGEEWLNWLKNNDPKDFDWLSKGKILLDIAYAPSQGKIVLDNIHNLIKAIKRWV